MVKLKFKFAGLEAIENLVNYRSKYIKYLVVKDPKIGQREFRSNDSNGLKYLSLRELAMAAQTPLHTLSITRHPKLRIVLKYYRDMFDDLEGQDSTEQFAVIENLAQFARALQDPRPVAAIDVYGPESAFDMNEVWFTKDTEVSGSPNVLKVEKPTYSNIHIKKEITMQEQSFFQAATQNITDTSKGVVNDALDVATGMAAVEVIKQIAFSIMPVKVGFIGRLMGANSWVKDNPFVVLGIVTVVHTILKSSQGRLSVNEAVMATADNALRYATFKAVEAFPIQKMIQDLSDKLAKVSSK